MFTVRKAQMEALARADLRRFKRLAARHLCEELPDAWAPESALLAFIDDGIARAGAQGVDEETEVLHYLELMSLLGPGFGADPRYELAMPLLDEDSAGVDWPEVRGIFLGLREDAEPALDGESDVDGEGQADERG
jgi:hypothetical protein